MHRSLLQTDQILCYGPEGKVIPCAGSGQDAAVAKGKAGLDSPRFRTTAWGVADRVTDAVWSPDANPAGFPLTWDEAFEFIAALNARCGYGRQDWQLPSRALLFSLFSHQYDNPALPSGHPFDNVFNGYYWTRNSCARLPEQAWYGHLGGGRLQRGMKHGSYLVWPVRVNPRRAAHREASDQRFRHQGDGIFDARTGLIWSRNANLLGCKLNWDQALSAVRSLNRKGGAGTRQSAWRLPNIRELESLVDLGAHSPALPAGHPFTDVQDGYWSSTTSAYEPRYAWTLYCRDGDVGVGFKSQAEFFLWPVRTRQTPKSDPAGLDCHPASAL